MVSLGILRRRRRISESDNDSERGEEERERGLQLSPLPCRVGGIAAPTGWLARLGGWVTPAKSRRGDEAEHEGSVCEVDVWQ